MRAILLLAAVAMTAVSVAKAAPAGVTATGTNAAFPLAEVTIEALQRRMAAGELTARGVAAAYLARIEAIDRAGPKLNAVIEVNPDALLIAEQLDAERRAGKVRGPMHGIPVLLKDNIATADKMETTAGSLALVGSRPKADAPLVARLREAGAVILGKTNLSEWANFRGTGSISGWSARGGLTKNPYAFDRTPSGSSSGSAAAVAANLCAVAVGTETTGSILSPAGACGIVGYKPTVGLVSRTGVIPIAATLDTAGPMTRTVRDAAVLLGAMVGEAADPRDAATAGRPEGMAVDFAAALKADALRGARLGVLRGPFEFRPNMDAVLEGALKTLRAAGAELVELGQFPALNEIGGARIEVMLYEMKHGIDAYLAELGPAARVKSLADVIAFNEAHAAEELKFFGQQYFVRAQAKGPLTDQAYRDAKAKMLRVARAEGIDAMVTRHRLDAIVVMGNAPAALVDPLFGGSTTGGAGYVLPAVAGYPSVIVPAAEMAGLPVGISFFGPAWSDATILALAADFEAHTKARREPKLRPSITRE